MHSHRYRHHPDWLARAEMLRRFASRIPQPPDEEPAEEVPPAPSAANRWPLPKLTYRHRSTFPRRPK